jgi:polar amino acid transport system substrate-binding protein
MSVACVTAVLAGVSACSGTSQATGPQPYPGVSPDPTLSAQIPENIRRDGNLTIVTDANYPPLEFIENKQLVGADIDLGRAIATKFGLAPNFQQTPFSNVVASVAIQEFELGISALWADNPEASLANMVTYYKAGTQVAIRKSEAIPSSGAGSFCGESVAVEEGTEYIDTLVKLSAACKKLGKAPIDIRPANNQQRASKLLEEGSTNAMVGDSPTVAYTVARSNGEIIAVGNPADIRPYGIAVSPMYPELTKATQQAVQQLIDSGVYAQILEKWQIPLGAIKTSEVLYGANPATP